MALMVLSVGALGVAGMAATASRSLDRALATEHAAATAALVLDSLLQQRAPEAGRREVGRYVVEWSTQPTDSGTRIELVVRFETTGERRRMRFGAIFAPAPRRLGGEGGTP